MFHMRNKLVKTADDLRGSKVRGPTRQITKMLGLLGATPVGMPLPQIPDALSYSPIPFESNTTGIVNLPAMVLVAMCAVLLVRGASESALVNTVMVVIKLAVLVLFAVIAFTAFEGDRFDAFWASGAIGVSAAARGPTGWSSSRSAASRSRLRSCSSPTGATC